MGILVECIEKQLLGSNAKLSAVTDGQIRSEIKTKLAGGSISFSTLEHSKTFRQWFSKERTWFIWLCLFLACTLGLYPATFPNYYPLVFSFFLLFVCLTLGILFAIIVGQTLGSKLILFVSWTILGSVIMGLHLYFFDFVFT
ncbi:hypothetical protein F4680DRAFT_437513 [Xylaria scruposa]|nr:hypothetical protein F4680DRAFT_437513 [Xylaria scruposa]